jgi:hypothetical protein
MTPIRTEVRMVDFCSWRERASYLFINDRVRISGSYASLRLQVISIPGRLGS